MFVNNLGLTTTRVTDAEFWEVMDFYKSAISHLKNKFAMELVTLTWVMVWGSFGVKPAKIPFSAVGQSWKRDTQELTFWKEIPCQRGTSLRICRSPHSKLPSSADSARTLLTLLSRYDLINSI